MSEPKTYRKTRTTQERKLLYRAICKALYRRPRGYF